MNHALRKAIRTLLQLIAAGGLTALVDALVVGLASNTKTIVLIAFGVIVTWTQNFLESHGTMPTLLPSPPVQGAPAPLAAKTPAGVVLNPGR